MFSRKTIANDRTSTESYLLGDAYGNSECNKLKSTSIWAKARKIFGLIDPKIRSLSWVGRSIALLSAAG